MIHQCDLKRRYYAQKIGDDFNHVMKHNFRFHSMTFAPHKPYRFAKNIQTSSFIKCHVIFHILFPVHLSMRSNCSKINDRWKVTNNEAWLVGAAWLFQKKSPNNMHIKGFGVVFRCPTVQRNLQRKCMASKWKRCHLRAFEMQDATHISIKLHFTSNTAEDNEKRGKKKCTRKWQWAFQTKWSLVDKVKTRRFFLLFVRISNWKKYLLS